MYYVVVTHKYGKSYLVVGEEISTLGSKRVATKFNSVKDAFDGACALQSCPIFARSMYHYKYLVEDDDGKVYDYTYEVNV